MTISEAAAELGVSAHTLRYYEKIGLVRGVERANGRRVYTREDVAWLEFVLRLKATSMPLRQIRAFAELRYQGEATFEQRREMLLTHRATLEREIGKMRSHLEMLNRKINFYTSKEGVMTRYDRGMQKLQEIDGAAGTDVVQSLAGIAPDFADYLIEFPFGDIYSRPELDLKSREVATIAALTAMGTATPQLKVHINAGLNVGLSREEIVEIIMQMAVYAGFPAALNGLFAAREVFARREADA